MRRSTAKLGAAASPSSLHSALSVTGALRWTTEAILCEQSYFPLRLERTLDRIGSYMKDYKATTPQAISRALNLPIDLARKTLQNFVGLVGANAFRLTYCLHRQGVGFFLGSREEMMEKNGDEAILYSIESLIDVDEVSVFFEENKAARTCLEQAQREGTLFACEVFGIRPYQRQIREAHMSKKRILVRLGRPPMSTNHPASEAQNTLKNGCNITELEEEEEGLSAPLHPPEPETEDVPPPCDISEVSTLDDIMCHTAPKKRRAPESAETPPVKRQYVEFIDLTKGISFGRGSSGRTKQKGRQVTLSAWLK